MLSETSGKFKCVFLFVGCDGVGELYVKVINFVVVGFGMDIKVIICLMVTATFE